MNEGSVARRYAKALFELAEAGGERDKVLAEMERFLGACSANDGELGGALASPMVTGVERTALVRELLPRLGISGTGSSFLRLLSDKNRMGALPDIVRAYRGLADTAAGRVRATVTTAVPLDAATLAEVTAALSRTTGKTAVVEPRVDPSLLGGLVARVGSVVYDASLLSRLERLQLSLTAPIQA